MGEEKEGRIVAYDLSIDQTPYRKDERDRCKKAGAAVMTMDQLEGYKPCDHQDDFGTEEDDDGDPPRLWVPSQGYPGSLLPVHLATRSPSRSRCREPRDARKRAAA